MKKIIDIITDQRIIADGLRSQESHNIVEVIIFEDSTHQRFFSFVDESMNVTTYALDTEIVKLFIHDSKFMSPFPFEGTSVSVTLDDSDHRFVFTSSLNDARHSISAFAAITNRERLLGHFEAFVSINGTEEEKREIETRIRYASLPSFEDAKRKARAERVRLNAARGKRVRRKHMVTFVDAIDDQGRPCVKSIFRHHSSKNSIVFTADFRSDDAV
jgi:hypothetical protein